MSRVVPPGGAMPFRGVSRGHALRRLLLSVAVAAMGLVDLLSAFLSRPPERLLAIRRLLPTEVLDTSRTFTLLAGALLLVTAWGLRRGKRRAYVMALFLCAVSVPMNLFKALDFEEAAVATALMFLLGVCADAFRVRSRGLSMSTLRSWALWFAIGLVVYAVLGSWTLKHVYGVAPSYGRAFEDAGYYLFGIGEPVALVTRPMPLAEARVVTWYHRSLPLLSFTLVLVVAIASLRPVRHRRRHRREAAHVAELLRVHGESSVSAFALDDDSDYFFSPNGRAVIAYRFENDTLLAVGDPIGPVEEHLPLLVQFEQHCLERDWQFAFFQARPEALDAYRQMGWRSIHIGEDPVIHLERFTLSGRAVGDARRLSRKAEAFGIEVHHFLPGVNPLGAGHGERWLEELRHLSQEWLRAHAGGEKNFCMGRFDAHHLPDVWTAVAWNSGARRIEGFVTWEPIPARRGWALDLMRRRIDSAPGTMELLIVRCLETARDRGDAMMSLALSALARVGDDTGSAAVVPSAPSAPVDEASPEPDRARAFLMEHLARFYDFKGLFTWKKKFDPVFEDRYLVYSHPLALPRVAWALARAQSPGGIRSYVRQLFARPVAPNRGDRNPPAMDDVVAAGPRPAGTTARDGAA